MRSLPKWILINIHKGFTSNWCHQRRRPPRPGWWWCYLDGLLNDSWLAMMMLFCHLIRFAAMRERERRPSWPMSILHAITHFRSTEYAKKMLISFQLYSKVVGFLHLFWSDCTSICAKKKWWNEKKTVEKRFNLVLKVIFRFWL